MIDVNKLGITLSISIYAPDNNLDYFDGGFIVSPRTYKKAQEWLLKSIIGDSVLLREELEECCGSLPNT